jgi:Fic family protein
VTFKPIYQITPKLLANLTQIERLYGQLEALRIPQKLELNLERSNLIRSSYISNSIEGNPLSLPEVTNLLLNDRLPINRNEKEIRNYFEILQNLTIFKENPPTLAIVCQIHRRLLTGVDNDIAGKIRNRRVIVGRYIEKGGKRILKVKHEPPFHRQGQIEKAVSELLTWVEEQKNLPVIIKAGAFHHHFVYLHPFSDGNGRVSRLLTALIFLKENYLLNKYFVLDDYYDINRELYSDKLNSADKGNKTEWLEYFSDGVRYSLQSALGRIRGEIEKLGIEERPTPRERAVLELLKERKEITSSDLTADLSISRQQAYNLLSGLVKKGFLGRKGKTKSSYYFLKTTAPEGTSFFCFF